MTPAYDDLLASLKKLPGLGYRSAERIAVHLLAEDRGALKDIIQALSRAEGAIGSCSRCGNLSEGELCTICSDPRRDNSRLCIVEHVPDLLAIERSAAWAGVYHVLNGKLSPIHGVGPEALRLDALAKRIEAEEVEELVLALSNDIEGQATCHYIQEEVVGDRPVRVTRIGFGLPSGSGVTFADSVTLKSALEGRREYSD